MQLCAAKVRSCYFTGPKRFCGGATTNFTECRLSFCLAQNVCDRHNTYVNKNLVWHKAFWTCKRTRHQYRHCVNFLTVSSAAVLNVTCSVICLCFVLFCPVQFRPFFLSNMGLDRAILLNLASFKTIHDSPK